MKKLLSGLLALVLVLSLLPLSAFAADTGKCGDNLTYTIANGVLTVSGTGAMTEYGTSENWPWYAQRDSITEVVIGEDVTYIGKYAFHGYDNLTKLTVRGSAKIGDYAFAFCKNLTTVWLAGTASTISFGAFNHCKNLGSFTLRAAVERSYSAFAAATSEGLDPEEVHLLDAGGKDVTQDYLITVKKGTSNSNYLTVAKATPTYTAPVAKTGLSYTGTMQQLVNPGSAVGGQMQYALGTATQATGTYSTQIPEAKDAGTYYVWYKVVATDTNLKDVAPACVSVTISKAAAATPTTPAGVNETILGKADGKLIGVDATMEYRKVGESTYTPITDIAVTNLAAGTYYVRYKERDNFYLSGEKQIVIAQGRKLTVTLPQNQVGYRLTADKSQLAYKESVTFTLDIGSGYSKTPGFAVKCNGQDVHWGDVTTISMQNCTEDLVITVEGVADVTAPTVKLSVADKAWTAFSNSIAFDLYYNAPQDVTITAADSGSGIRSIRYHLGFDQMGLDEVQAITDWTDYNGTFKIAPNNHYVIYVQVVDNAGNGTCVNSDGIVLDNIAPTLEGIEDGKTYYGDLTVIKSEEQFYHIKQVTLDGQDMGFLEGTYGLIPADNGQHTVVVEDHAGNKTTYTVTVMKQYTVTFMADGKVYNTQKVGHGMVAAIPQPPEKKGYTVAWDKEPGIITENITVTAVYTPIAETPKTGDTVNTGWLILVMLLSATAMAVLVVTKKKLRERE